jgi:hypothetical protein
LVDFETPVCKLYLLFLSANAAQEKEKREESPAAHWCFKVCSPCGIALLRGSEYGKTRTENKIACDLWSNLIFTQYLAESVKCFDYLYLKPTKVSKIKNCLNFKMFGCFFPFIGPVNNGPKNQSKLSWMLFGNLDSLQWCF